jgi:hypothetical protein
MHKQCLGVEHAHLMCVLLVCLCEPDPVNLALERISSADLILSSISILFFNLPSGYATWHNFFLCCACMQESGIDQDDPEDHQVQD